MFLALLVVLALAYFGVLSMGGNGGQGTRSPKWLERLGDAMMTANALSMRQTSAPCKKGEVYLLFEGETCRVDIPAGDGAVRSGRLQLDLGRRLAIEMEQPGSVPQRQELRAGGDPVKLQVFDKGADLELRCIQGGGDRGRKRCEVRLAGS